MRSASWGEGCCVKVFWVPGTLERMYSACECAAADECMPFLNGASSLPRVGASPRTVRPGVLVFTSLLM